MLVHCGADLPQKMPVLSPGVDADLGVPADEVAAALAVQTGRRVVKTHTPTDGFPVWDGVTVIAVYRHPLDLLFSMRKHTANQTSIDPDNPSGWPLARSIWAFIHDPTAHDALANDNLANIAMHYSETALSGRLPDLKLFHYANMIRDGRRAVHALAQAAGIDANDGLIEKVAATTAFGALKAKAADFAPVAGTGFWKSDINFFGSANSGKWEGQLSADEHGLYRERLAALVPDPATQVWLEQRYL